MKKILSCVLCLAMIASMGVTSFAAEIDTDGGSQETVVTYGMAEGFTVTIPTNFTIDDSKKATANVSASDVMIAHGATLEVTISGNDYVDSWELIDTAEVTNQLTYTIGSTDGGSDIVNGSVVLSVASGEAYNSTVTETMYFTVVDELSKAGEYTDTLTFTVSVGAEKIAFTIDGVAYTAEAGWTWGDWVNSEYNTLGLVLRGDNVMDSKKEQYYEIEDVTIYATHLIVSDGEYFGYYPPI